MNTKVIVAIATPSGNGGIGILRLSGEGSKEIADALFFSKSKEWKPLLMKYGTFKGIGFNDKGYAVYMPEGQSYTGEETIEFYLHGGMRIMQGALETVISKGARLAESGEFTKRAFLNGRLSLSDCEGVIDMINAESLGALKVAYNLMNGTLANKIKNISNSLEKHIVELTASLDYPDEMEDEVLSDFSKEIPKIKSELISLRDSFKVGKMIKTGVNCVLSGDVNVGKSSLLNAIVKEERAIVTAIPGTTRDVIKESIEYKGLKLTFIDTAGIREGAGEIEQRGIEKGNKEKEEADVILEVYDAEKIKDIPQAKEKTIYVINKMDKVKKQNKLKREDVVFVSAKENKGIQEMLDKILQLTKTAKQEDYEMITTQRHHEALKNAIQELEEIRDNEEIDLMLVTLLRAKKYLSAITGEESNEDTINKIFDRFCVGK